MPASPKRLDEKNNFKSSSNMYRGALFQNAGSIKGTGVALRPAIRGKSNKPKLNTSLINPPDKKEEVKVRRNWMK